MKRNFAATVALIALSAVTLVGCAADQPVPRIESFTFTQSKAVPNYDSATYTVTDADRIAALETILTTYDWQPGWTHSGNDGCVGGTSTAIDIAFVDDTTATIDTYQCQSDDPFVTELTDLVESWH